MRWGSTAAANWAGGFIEVHTRGRFLMFQCSRDSRGSVQSIPATQPCPCAGLIAMNPLTPCAARSFPPLPSSLLAHLPSPVLPGALLWPSALAHLPSPVLPGALLRPPSCLLSHFIPAPSHPGRPHPHRYQQHGRGAVCLQAGLGRSSASRPRSGGEEGLNEPSPGLVGQFKPSALHLDAE